MEPATKFSIPLVKKKKAKNKLFKQLLNTQHKLLHEVVKRVMRFCFVLHNLLALSVNGEVLNYLQKRKLKQLD